MSKKLIAAVVSLAIVTAWLGVGIAQDEGASGHTIKDVMKTAHKEGLLKKVTGGQAEQGEKIELLNLYLSLRDNDPPKGDADSWKSLTDALAISAAKVVAGRDDGVSSLKKASVCGTCHKAHKGS